MALLVGTDIGGTFTDVVGDILQAGTFGELQIEVAGRKAMLQ